MNMGPYNYSFSSTLGMLLLLLTKFLTIVLAIVFVLGIAAWIKELFIKNQNSKLFKDLNSDPIIKNVTVITGAILGLVLVFALISSLFQPSFGGNMNMGGYNMGFSFGFNPMASIVGILSILIRILTFVLVVSLILAVLIYLKDQYESGKLDFLTSKKNENTSNIIIDSKDNNSIGNTKLKNQK